jgi:hypothetical protein
VACPRTAGLALASSGGGVDEPVDAGSGRIEGQRIQQRLDALEPILPTSALLGVVGRVRAGGQFGEGDRRDRRLERQRPGRQVTSTARSRAYRSSSTSA